MTDKMLKIMAEWGMFDPVPAWFQVEGIPTPFDDFWKLNDQATEALNRSMEAWKEAGSPTMPSIDED